MATKTITLELDAYEKLKAARLREKESFSSVVRRAEFLGEPHTGAYVLARLQGLAEKPSEAVIEYWERMRREDVEKFDGI